MRVLIVFLAGLNSFSTSAQDTTFYDYAETLDSMETGFLHHDWGSENITYLGRVKWKSPTGKELQVKIVTTYQKITKANGFNDRSLLALLTADHRLVKTYDMVKRQNLPVAIENNQLVFHPSKEKRIVSELPSKFGVRFCVVGLTCFTEFIDE